MRILWKWTDVGVVMFKTLIYPVAMISVVGLHYQLLDNLENIQLATYIPVILGAIAITFFEWKYPHSRKWYPDHEEICNDLIFMALVQLLRPRLLSFSVAVTLLAMLNQNELTVNFGGSHELPVAAQAILMLLAADIVRYWLHRAAHEWLQPLCCLYAVHHSPINRTYQPQYFQEKILKKIRKNMVFQKSEIMLIFSKSFRCNVLRI